MDVKTLCLGLLATGDRSGYAIKKTLEERFHHFFSASFGSIYPALAELERTSLVEVEEVSSEGGRAKKLYHLTDAGRSALLDALDAEEPRHIVRSDFLVLLYFGHLLSYDRLNRVVQHRIAAFEDMLHSDLERFENLEDELEPGQRFALGYARTVLTAALGYLKRQHGELMRELNPPSTNDDDLARPRIAAAGD